MAGLNSGNWAMKVQDAVVVYAEELWVTMGEVGFAAYIPLSFFSCNSYFHFLMPVLWASRNPKEPRASPCP